LKFINIDLVLPAKALALEPDVERVNASVALAIARAFLKEISKENRDWVSEDILHGIKQYSWPGRFQHIVNGNHQWFLDVAHNELSLEIAARWFAKTATAMQRYLHLFYGIDPHVNIF
jgi:folylpolyglutamate synthase